MKELNHYRDIDEDCRINFKGQKLTIDDKSSKCNFIYAAKKSKNLKW